MKYLNLATVIIASLILITHANAQGCAQCLDNTQSTPPAVQAAYRHAIFLLAGAGCTLFAAAFVIFKRNR